MMEMEKRKYAGRFSSLRWLAGGAGVIAADVDRSYARFLEPGGAHKSLGDTALDDG